MLGGEGFLILLFKQKLSKREAEGAGKARVTKAKFLAVGEACKAIFLTYPWVNNDTNKHISKVLNPCVSDLHEAQSACSVKTKQTKKPTTSTETRGWAGEGLVS